MTQKSNKEEKSKLVVLPTKLSLTIRTLVGGYLLYTSYSLIDGFKTTAGTEKYVLGAFLVGFAIIGVGLIIVSMGSMSKGKYIGGAMDVSEDETSENNSGQEADAWSSEDNEHNSIASEQDKQI